MSGQQQIIRHFPHFFRTGDQENLFYRFVAVFGAMLEGGERDLVAMMRSHWVNTADNEGSIGLDTKQRGDLDKIFALYLEALGGTSLLRQSGRRAGAEGLADDALYRLRMKGLINILRQGPSTLHGIREIIAANLGIYGDSAAANAARESIVITEYLPQEYSTKTYHLKLFEPFVVKNYNVEDTPIAIKIKAKPNLLGIFPLTKLKIINSTSGQFAERDKPGALSADESEEISQSYQGKQMILPTGASLWSVEGIIGQFFESTYLETNHRFNKAVFAPSGPVIELSMSYTRFRPASFRVQIPWDIPHFSELLDQQADNPRLQIPAIIQRVKAAGVWAELIYRKTFIENWDIAENFTTESEDQPLQEDQEMADGLCFGGIFDVTRFDCSLFNEKLKDTDKVRGIFDVTHYDSSLFNEPYVDGVYDVTRYDESLFNENFNASTEDHNNMKETQSITGRLHIRVVNQNGDTVDERRINNQITLSGKYMVAQLFSGNKEVNAVGFFGVGTGVGATQDTMTDLEKPVQILKTQLRKALTKPLKVEAELDEDENPTGRIKVILRGELNSNEPYNTGSVILTEAGLFTVNQPVKTTGGDEPTKGQGGILLSGGGSTPMLGDVSVPGRKLEIGEGNTLLDSKKQENKAVAFSTAKRSTARSLAEFEPGAMYNRVVFQPITKTPQFKLELIWEVIF